MRMVDDRGRLFGRINLIDAAVLVFAAVLIPLGYMSYRLFRVLPPSIGSVEPAEAVQGQTARIRLRGEHLRFADVYVNDLKAGALLIENPLVGEVTLPDGLAPGIYDISMRERGQEIARARAALTVITPRTSVSTVVRTAELGVRFLVFREVVPLLRAGLRDQPTATPATREETATLLSFRKTGELSGPTSINVGLDTFPEWFQVPQTVAVLDARVRVPVVRGPEGWRYAAQPLKLGALFTFENPMYYLRGWIVSIDMDGHEELPTHAKP